LELYCKEVVIFKYAKNTEIIDNAEPKKEFGFLSIRRSNPEAVGIVQRSAKHKQPHKLPTPPTIEEVTGNQYQSILPAQFFIKNKPIQYKYDRQKQ
jgi:hypothetical protein